MAGITLKVNSSKIIITGVNLMNYAKRYNEAAIIASQYSSQTVRFDPVPYQLYCQSLELHLKSFIWLNEKCGKNKLKNKYGHNIEKLWEHSKVRGINQFITITPLREQVISLVGPYYKDKKFCYLDIDMIYDGYKNLKKEPKSLQTLKRLTTQLGISLREPILNATQPK